MIITNFMMDTMEVRRHEAEAEEVVVVDFVVGVDGKDTNIMMVTMVTMVTKINTNTMTDTGTQYEGEAHRGEQEVLGTIT